MPDTALLGDVRVVDFSQFLPGPYATHLMATLGADVVKIEPPGGDPMRKLLCPDGEALSPLYRQVNAGKTILFRDLKCPADRDQVKALLSRSHVMLNGYRPGVMDRLGLSAGVLEDINPGLVHCHLSGFGATGPYRFKAGHDINYCALAGLYSFHDEDRFPEMAFPLLADHVGALQAVNAILAALYRREKTGQGCHLDISLYETLFSWQSTDRLQGVRSLLTGGAACYNMYRTADQRILTLGALEEKFWKRFCRAIGQPGLAVRHADPIPQLALISRIREIIAGRPAAAWENRFREIDCCVQLVPLPDEITMHDHSLSRGVLEGDQVHYPGKIDGFGTPPLPACRDSDRNESFEWKTTR
ncbi:MAG: CoA transferase [Gammaproteobacteria bacterium]|nr:CoA transferase [Gammaproteobacteria bacterium]